MKKLFQVVSKDFFKYMIGFRPKVLFTAVWCSLISTVPYVTGLSMTVVAGVDDEQKVNTDLL